MQRVSEELKQLLNYEKLSAISVLDPPKVEKKDIPSFFFCPNYEKAQKKTEQTMDRYNRKVEQVNGEIQQIRVNIEGMQKEQKKWSGKASTFLLDRTDPKAVEKQNHAANMANSYLDKIANAGEKHDDLIDKHNAAVEEAREKLEELTADALLVIDEDIVAVLDKCSRVVDKFAGSQNTEDLVGAIEICMIELKIFNLFEDMIDGNASRKECRDRIVDVNKHFSELCENEHVRNFLCDLYRKNVYLVQKNGEIYTQITKAIGSVDINEIGRLTQGIAMVLGEEFDTAFAYEGVVDPTELNSIMKKIGTTIKALRNNIGKAKAAFESTKSASDEAVGVNKNVLSLLESMKANVENMRNDIISAGHFATEMIAETVIDDFFHKDLRPSATTLRRHLIKVVGEEQVDSLVLPNQDRFSLSQAENAINQANLTRLHVERAKVDEHVKKLNDMISAAEEDVKKAEEVPQKNAAAWKKGFSIQYIFSCIPVIGFLFAIGILGKLKKLEAAFRSSNQTYKELGTAILAKNKTMTIVVLLFGFVFGIGGEAAVVTLLLGPELNAGGAGSLFGALFGPDKIMYAATPVGVFVLYFITMILLVFAGKRLRSYMGLLPTAAKESKSA